MSQQSRRFGFLAPHDPWSDGVYFGLGRECYTQSSFLTEGRQLCYFRCSSKLHMRPPMVIDPIAPRDSGVARPRQLCR